MDETCICAVHCIDCGILIGYDYTITESFCVECGQMRLVKELSNEPR